MSIQIVIEDTVGFKVKGTYNTAKGVARPFEFMLECERLDVDGIEDRVKNASDTTTIPEFLAQVVKDWSGVKDAAGAPLAYSEAELRKLCKIPGVSRLAFDTYMQEVGVKAKN